MTDTRSIESTLSIAEKFVFADIQTNIPSRLNYDTPYVMVI